MAVVGKPADADAVRNLIAACRLELEDSVMHRSYFCNRPAGYQLMCSEGSVNTVFLYVVPDEGFKSFRDPLPEGLSGRDTRAEVLRRFGTPERSGEPSTSSGIRTGAWDRFVVGTVCVHFEYTEPEERIRRVTLMVAGKAP